MKTALIGDTECFSAPNSTAGAYFTDLALTLNATASSLQCFALPAARGEKAPLLPVLSFLQQKGVRAHVVPMPAVVPARSPHGKIVYPSYVVYETLKSIQDLDVVHVVGDGSLAHYFLAGREQGLTAASPKVVVHVIAPFLYKLTKGMRDMSDYADLALCHMEKRVIETADVVIAQSEAVADWMSEVGYEPRSGRARVAPGIADIPVLSRPASGDGKVPIQRIVFGGRLNDARGLTTFVYALDKLIGSGCRPSSILLAGAQDADFPVHEFVADYAARWQLKVGVETKLERRRFLLELQRPGTLAVIPPIVDGLPIVVQECLALDVPFVATAVGDIPKHVPAPLHETRLCAPDHHALAALMRRWLEGSIVESSDNVVRPSLQDNAGAWRALLGDIAATPAAPRPAAPIVQPIAGRPCVSVCIAHFNRPQLLALQLDSIKAQTFQDMELIVVDDGSTRENIEAVRALLADWPNARLIPQDNRYLGAARNTGARAATGKYLLFKDDDNISRPDEVETFAKVAERTKSHIFVCFSDNFSGDALPTPQTLNGIRRMPIGQDVLYGLFRNGYGDSNCFMSKSVWDELGGFSEHYKIGLDDHELFTRATFRGMKIEVIPEALYFYRLGGLKMKRFHVAKHANFNRIVTPYLATKELPAAWLPMLFASRAFYNSAMLAQATQKTTKALPGE